MIFRDGWYYLLVTHGSCCAGASSTYNIRMGRSRKVTGPFLDNMGIDMLQGGGKLFAGSSGRHVGPGHFGLLDLGDGVEKFSLHYEADLDRGGVSVLDIRPLLWRDGWPVAGDNLTAAPTRSSRRAPAPSSRWRCRACRSAGRGRVAAAVGQAGRWRRRGGRPPRTDPAAGSRARRGELAGRRRRRAHGAAHAAGPAEVDDHAGAECRRLPGSPYFRIAIAGTDRALAATSDAELTVLPAFTGGPEQLWRIDQLADGTYRLMPKAVPSEGVAGAVGRRQQLADAGQFRGDGDRQRWTAQDSVIGHPRTTSMNLRLPLSSTPALVVLGSRGRLAQSAGARRRRPPAAAPAGGLAVASRVAVEGARCRRLHPALARAGAHRVPQLAESAVQALVKTPLRRSAQGDAGDGAR